MRLKQNKKQIIVNMPAALASLLSLTAYTLALAAAAEWFIKYTSLLTPKIQQLPVNNPKQAVATGDGLTGALSGSFAIGLVVLSLFILLTLPYFAGRFYAKTLRRTMKLLKIPFTFRNLVLTKMISYIAPLIIFIVLGFNPYIDITYVALFLLTFGTVVMSLGLSGVQVFLVSKLAVSLKKIW
jgi:hypothetical protein